MKRTLFHSYITRFFLAAALLGQLSCGKDPAVSPSGNESGSSTETSSETETRILKEASSGSTPANIIIMGDGFTKEDYAANGTFYPAATRAMNGLLSVEPFKTYSAYFRVQTVAVYSQERGTSFKNSSTQKNTAFSTILDGGGSTGISGNNAEVLRYTLKAQDIDNQSLKNTTIIVIVNYPTYAGTTTMYSDGRAIAYVALSNGTSQQTQFEHVVIHEAGGHGFGMLSDEYYDPNSGSINNDKEALEELQKWQGYGLLLNVSLTSNQNLCPWKFIFNWPQYSTEYRSVNTYEGGALFAKGVWRSEPISCMEDNRPYFNAASRYAIVKRILNIAGKELTTQQFIQNDHDRFNTAAMQAQTRSTISDKSFVPLASPIIVKAE